MSATPPDTGRPDPGPGGPTAPVIRPAARLIGKTLVLRNAGPDDAPFIFALRTDPEKARYLSPVSPHLEDQRDWLARYQTGTGQAYFIIEHGGQAIGTIRLYDAQGDSFCWGSWILTDARPRQAAVESILMVFIYAIDHLGFRRTHFDVRAANARAIAFYDRIGGTRTGISGEDILYELTPRALAHARIELADFLPGGLRIES